MIWQDLVLTFANLIFAISLIPQVYLGFKTKTGAITLATSIPTSTGLYIISFAYYTLSLNYSSILSFVNGTFWFILFIQRIYYKK